MTKWLRCIKCGSRGQLPGDRPKCHLGPCGKLVEESLDLDECAEWLDERISVLEESLQGNME